MFCLYWKVFTVQANEECILRERRVTELLKLRAKMQEDIANAEKKIQDLRSENERLSEELQLYSVFLVH